MTVSHLDRHRAAVNQLPNPRCCALCQAKATRNIRRTQNADRDAGQSGVDRGRAMAALFRLGGMTHPRVSLPNQTLQDMMNKACLIRLGPRTMRPLSNVHPAQLPSALQTRVSGGRDCVPWREETRKAEPGCQWALVDSRKSISGPGYGRLRFKMFESVHIHPFSGHYGQSRTQKKAPQLYFWPTMAADIKRWWQNCDSCQRVKAERRKPKGALEPLEVPDRRWESVSMDLITDLPVT